MKVTINGDEEASPLLASEVAAGGLSPACRRLRLVRASLALSFATLILWTALLTTGAVSASLRYYTPHTSIIDIILVDALRSLFAVGVMLSSKERALTLCTYIASLSILLILAKPWVYRAWRTHPANTAALVIAALASVAHLALPYLILQIDNPPTQRLRWSAVKRILRPYFIPKGCGNKLLVLLTWVILIAGRVCQIASPIVLGMLVSKLSQRPPQDPTMLIGVYCLLNVLPKYFSEIQDTLYVRVWQRAYAEVADTTFRHMHSLSLEWHLKKKMGNVMRAMDRGLEAADTLMYYAMLFLLPAVGSALASFIVFAAHFKQAQIAAITFIGFCLYMWITLVVTLWRRKFREEMNQHDNNLHDLATDSMINFETVKQFTNEDYEAERYNAGVVAYQRSTYTSQASMSLLNVSQATTIQLAMLGSLMVAAYAVSHDEDGFDSGSFVAVQAYVLTIFQPLSYLGMIYNQIINSLVDLQNLSDLLAEQPDVVDAPDAQQLRLPKDPTEGVGIEFRDVWFKYPTQKEGQGLRGVSFVIKPGTTTAIVGSTGSGKTTTSRLLFRFYDVDRGAILVGGQDITKVTQRSLRRAIGVVPQDTCMFNSTIMANVRYGRNDATDEEVYDAARRAQLYDLVQNLELKFDTVVGERGLKLSGGEKQRVAIARCLLKDPPVVVLDEATSSLDNKTERDIQEALRCLEGRTTLVIAHRLSTIQRAHQIIVMDKGQIAERGTHDELLSRPGSLYSELWNAQVIATPTPEAADGDGAASSLAAADM